MYISMTIIYNTVLYTLHLRIRNTNPSICQFIYLSNYLLKVIVDGGLESLGIFLFIHPGWTVTFQSTVTTQNVWVIFSILDLILVFLNWTTDINNTESYACISVGYQVEALLIHKCLQVPTRFLFVMLFNTMSPSPGQKRAKCWSQWSGDDSQT